jgi:hypothetical protein
MGGNICGEQPPWQSRAFTWFVNEDIIREVRNLLLLLGRVETLGKQGDRCRKVLRDVLDGARDTSFGIVGAAVTIAQR